LSLPPPHPPPPHPRTPSHPETCRSAVWRIYQGPTIHDI
jgi:hypothetical protein